MLMMRKRKKPEQFVQYSQGYAQDWQQQQW